DTYTTYRIRLPRIDAAKFEAAHQSHRDKLIADHDSESETPFPTNVDAFMSLVDAGWDADVARRPHGQHTTVIIHVDIDKPAALHLGPVLTDADRRYLLCDTTCEVWFQRDGQPIGAGRATRTINRRLRRALEHRDRHCAVPGCGATRGLHAHHITHWEDGGQTELNNLILLCPYHHRLAGKHFCFVSAARARHTIKASPGHGPSNGRLGHVTTTDPVLKQLVADANAAEVSIELTLYLPSGVLSGDTTTEYDFGRWTTLVLGQESGFTGKVEPDQDDEYVHLAVQTLSLDDEKKDVVRIKLSEVIAWTVG
ncbi:MAG: DUF222 domain-containing protein, partial [Mycolicibacterium cosmeticum]|nr:DUF222 domain-containing protein [Mycolicibacterium cosmeticum]